MPKKQGYPEGTKGPKKSTMGTDMMYRNGKLVPKRSKQTFSDQSAAVANSDKANKKFPPNRDKPSPRKGAPK